MKKVFLFTSILFMSVFLFLSCTDKKPSTNSESQVDMQELKKIEQESQELETLEKTIEKDIKELDDLLESI